MTQTVAEMEADISDMREARDALMKKYDKATSDKVLRDVGGNVNRLNSEIDFKRTQLEDIAFDSVMSAQKIEAEVKTLRGSVERYERLEDEYTDKDDIREIGLVIAENERDIYLNEIKIEGLLPEGYDSPEHVATRAEEIVQSEREKWFDNSGIKNKHLNTIKYGKTYVDEKGNVREVPGVIKTSIAEHKRAIENVGGIRRDVIEDELLTKTGKPIRFDEKELGRLAKISDPGIMVSAINDACTTKQIGAFKNALASGDISKVCKNEMHDAMDYKADIERDAPGSGDHYMKTFLKNVFGEDFFDDNVYNELSTYNSSDDLLNYIGDELLDVIHSDEGYVSYGNMLDSDMLEKVGVVCNVDGQEIYEAFHYKYQLEKGIPGSGDEYMKRFLKKLFGDTFSDAVYEDMSDYTDGDMLVRRINDGLLEAGIYDNDVISYAIDEIDRDALTSRIDTEAQLDSVFGDHFTKLEYDSVAKNIGSRISTINKNREGLLMQFRSLGDDGQIRAGKIIEGISNEDFKAKWDKEMQKMFEHGETTSVGIKIKKRQVDYAKRLFETLVKGIPYDDMLTKQSMENVFVSKRLQPYVVRRLMAGVTDIEYVIDNNAKMIERNMRDLVKKHRMYRSDIFSEGRIYDAMDERAKKEMGDPKGAHTYMKNEISSAVGDIDMTGYGDELIKMSSKKIRDDYESIDSIVKEFARRKHKFITDAQKEISDVGETAFEKIYAGEDKEFDVDIPKREKVEKEEEVVVPKVVIPGYLTPMMSEEEMEEFEDVAPKIPDPPRSKKEQKTYGKQMRIVEKWEEFRERAAPFRERGLVLKKRVGAEKKYVVYGYEGKTVGFKTMSELDKWFKENAKGLDKKFRGYY